MSKRKVIITGALGFIGSHTAKVFKKLGWHVIGIDRNYTIPEAAQFLDEMFIEDFARMTPPVAAVADADAIVHCAGTSLVGPSLKNPGEYYNNNCAKTNLMMTELGQHGWKGVIVFSSSAATYGIPKDGEPLYETSAQDPISPYGWSKLFCEHIIKDHCAASGMRGIALRYFNACGCDADGDLGHVEDDTHMIPRVLSAYHNYLPFNLYGDDYATPDGTCIRDYLHVTDIAWAHLLAVEYMSNLPAHKFDAFNLGTGRGYSNREVMAACEQVVGDQIGWRVVERRVGDPDQLIADSSRFQRVTSWSPVNSSLDNIVRTAWQWQQRYPKRI